MALLREGMRREGREENEGEGSEEVMEGEGRGEEGGEGRGEEAFLVMWPRMLSSLNPPLRVKQKY